MQIGNDVLGIFGAPGSADRAKRLNEQAEVRQSMLGPIYDTPAGIFGRVVPALAIPGSTIPRAALGGLLYGALQPVAGEGQRTQNALGASAGFAGGNAAARLLGKGLARVISPLHGPKPVTPIQAERTRVADEALNLGLAVSAGSRSGNRLARGMESVLGTLPVTGYRQRIYQEKNLARANQILAEQFGSNAEVLGPKVVADARQRIGQEFERLVTPRTPINVDGRYMAAMNDLKKEFNILPPKFRNKRVKDVIEEFYDSIEPTWKRNAVFIDGERYQVLRSELSDQSRQLFSAHKRNAARRIDKVVDALDDMAQRSLPKADMEAFQLARRQWQATHVAEDAADKYGNLQIGRLDRAIARHLPRAGKGGDIYRRLSRSMELIKDQIANSGTPERLNVMSMLQSPEAAVAGLSGLTLAAGPVGAGYAIAAPLLAQAMLLNPRAARLLSNNAAARMAGSPVMDALSRGLLRSAGAAGIEIVPEGYERLQDRFGLAGTPGQPPRAP
jgi:hypothetical protein